MTELGIVMYPDGSTSDVVRCGGCPEGGHHISFIPRKSQPVPLWKEQL